MSVGLFALIVLFRVLVYSYFVMTYSDCLYHRREGTLAAMKNALSLA